MSQSVEGLAQAVKVVGQTYAPRTKGAGPAELVLGIGARVTAPHDKQAMQAWALWPCCFGRAEWTEKGEREKKSWLSGQPDRGLCTKGRPRDCAKRGVLGQPQSARDPTFSADAVIEYQGASVAQHPDLDILLIAKLIEHRHRLSRVAQILSRNRCHEVAVAQTDLRK